MTQEPTQTDAPLSELVDEFAACRFARRRCRVREELQGYMVNAGQPGGPVYLNPMSYWIWHQTSRRVAVREMAAALLDRYPSVSYETLVIQLLTTLRDLARHGLVRQIGSHDDEPESPSSHR